MEPKPVAAELPKRNRWIGLAAILTGIVLGVLFGVVYGRQMWLASGGPEKRLERLEKTAAQKDRFAKAADVAGRAKEAQRLRDQAAVVRGEIVKTRQIIKGLNPQKLRFAAAAYRFVSFVGEVFLRLLFVMVVPLVFTSMVCGITSLGDIRKLGKIGGWTLTYYMATAAVAVLIGIVLVQLIEPGVGTDDTFAYVDEDLLNRPEASAMDTLFDVVRGSKDKPGGGMIPDNIFLAASSTNVLAVIAFALVFGAALSTLGKKGAPAIDFFVAANDAVMKMVHWVILLAPVGIFGLVATRIADSGGGDAFYEELARLGWFVATVLLGLAMHVGVLCTLLAVLAKKNPLGFVVSVGRALLTALSTSSSSATLPVTMECVEETGVSKRSASFVLPLGATINMDGTALYEATAAVFIAQSAGIPLSGTALVIVFITATLAAIGAPGIPEAGLVTMLIVLAAAGLPASGIGTIWAIDWFLDRNRTAVNVFGDAVGAAIIDHHFGEKD